MATARDKAAEFLHRYRMDYLDIDFEEAVAAFLDEMQRGLEGGESSLEMLPTYLQICRPIPPDRPVIAIDAGGTNFRRALVRFDNSGRPIIERLKNFRMPGTEGKISGDEFFALMADCISDIAAESRDIGFCFSYALDMMPCRDGKLIRLSKEIDVEGIVGRMIGEGLVKVVGRNQKAVVLNDTAAVLLASICGGSRKFGSYLGFILGTGTNCCYIERGENIKKAPPDVRTGSQIINIESAGFSKCTRGVFDRRLDETTANCGQNVFEKMFSGAYLGSLYLLALQQAAKDGLFCSLSKEGVLGLSNLETKLVNDFLMYPDGENLLAGIFIGSRSDLAFAEHLAQRLVERAAMLSAIVLTAAARKSVFGSDLSMPICIAAEGSTFKLMKDLKRQTDFYLDKYLRLGSGICYEFVDVGDNAVLLGAAIAGLTN